MFVSRLQVPTLPASMGFSNCAMTPSKSIALQYGSRGAVHQHVIHSGAGEVIPILQQADDASVVEIPYTGSSVCERIVVNAQINGRHTNILTLDRC